MYWVFVSILIILWVLAATNIFLVCAPETVGMGRQSTRATALAPKPWDSLKVVIICQASGPHLARTSP